MTVAIDFQPVAQLGIFVRTHIMVDNGDRYPALMPVTIWNNGDEINIGVQHRTYFEQIDLDSSNFYCFKDPNTNFDEKLHGLFPETSPQALGSNPAGKIVQQSIPISSVQNEIDTMNGKITALTLVGLSQRLNKAIKNVEAILQP